MRYRDNCLITIALDIVRVSDWEKISAKRSQYTYAIHYAYRRIHEVKEAQLVSDVMDKFGLNTIEARSVIVDTKMRLEQNKTNKKNIEERIVDNEKEIEKLRSKSNRKAKDTRKLFKLVKKNAFLSDSLSRDITFGGKDRLKRISYLSNMRGQDISWAGGKTASADKELAKLLKEYKNERKLDIFVIGEANQKGNRFFEFDLKNSQIIYKPCKGEKIVIDYAAHRNNKLEMDLLARLIKSKEISITVRIEHDQIHLSYDNEITSGFFIDKKQRREDVADAVKDIICESDKKDIINSVYKLHYEKLKNQKLGDKNPNRFFAVDLNPDHIGCSVLERIGEDSFRVIYAVQYDLSHLNRSLPSSAKPRERNKHNNRKKNELCNAWKDIFNTLHHFNCGHFVSEDLDMKHKDTDEFSTEANRKNKNLWHRELSRQQIAKHTTRRGIIHTPVNACYTSTIGNILYEFVDAVNASIEIGRRGIFQYVKGAFYPPLGADTIGHAMSRLLVLNPQLRDVDFLKDCTNWVELHRALKKLTGIRYRVSSIDDMCLATGKSKLDALRQGKVRHLAAKKTIFKVEQTEKFIYS